MIFDPKHANFKLNCHLTISLMMCNLKGHNLKFSNFERWKIKIFKILGSVWYICLKTENCCLKIFVEIHMAEKMR